MTVKKWFKPATLILISLALSVAAATAEAAAPLNAGPALPVFEAFVATVSNGKPEAVRGVYVPEVLALSVQQQPANQPFYISSQDGVATQFMSASKNNVIGLLAHNYAGGASFFNLAPGQEARIVYGDGQVKLYSIASIYSFQALDPNSPYSDFIDLSTGKKLTAAQVFAKVYRGGPHVVFQTCIKKGGLSTWGRLFVIATPVEK